MPKITPDYITISLHDTKQTINFNISCFLIGSTNDLVMVDDEVRIFYSRYDWENNTWESESLIRSPFSYRVSTTKPIFSYNVKDNFITNIGGRYKFRLAIYRNNSEIFSTIHQFKVKTGRKTINTLDYIDTSRLVTQPRNVNVNRNTGLITWSPHVAKYNDLPLKHFLLTASYSKTLSIQRIVSKTATQYLFDNLKPGSVRFVIQAVDVADNKSRPLAIKYTPHNVNPTPSYEVFDKSSWQNKISNNKLKTALDAAANRWNTYIKFNPEIYTIIQQSYEFKSNYRDEFKGIRLREFSYISEEGVAARCGPRAYVQIDNLKRNTIDFVLYVNPTILSSSYSDTNRINILTHELGHALGIGGLWSYNTSDPFPYSLNGDYINYPEAQKAYKQFMLNLYPPGSIWEDVLPFPLPTNPKYIPLNFEGIGAGSHWSHIENTYNTLTQQYPPLTDDIMSYGNIDYITPVSIKFLVDLGYEEKNPGTSEYNGTGISQQAIILSNQNSKCGVNQDADMLKPILAIDASDENNVVIYDENIEIAEEICITPTPEIDLGACVSQYNTEYQECYDGFTYDECQRLNQSNVWFTGTCAGLPE